MLRRNVPLILDRKFEGGTPVNLILKDLALIEELSGELGTKLSMEEQAKAVFEDGRTGGLGNLDMSSLVQLSEKIAGITVQK